MCGCKEIACEVMICWNLKIRKIGRHCDKRELWILIDWQATSFTASGVPANFWKMWSIRHLDVVLFGRWGALDGRNGCSSFW